MNQDSRRSTTMKKIVLQRLPYEILLDIFSRLSIQDLSQLKFLSKNSNKILSQLIKDPFFIQLHHSRTIQHEEYSNFVVISHKSKSNDLINFYLVNLAACPTSVKISNINIDVPGQVEMVGSANGLMCLVSLPDYKTFYLCNPITGVISKFSDAPPIDNTILGENNAFSNFGHFEIAFDLSTNTYKVFRSWSYFNKSNYLSSITMDTCNYGNTWRTRVTDVESCRFTRHTKASSVLVRGALHWLVRYETDPSSFDNIPESRILAMDVGDESLMTIDLPSNVKMDDDRLRPLRQGRSYYLLLLFEGCLSVLVNRNRWSVFRMWVMEDYGVSNSWTLRYVFRKESFPSRSFNFPSNACPLKIIEKMSDGTVFIRWQEDYGCYNLKSEEFIRVALDGILLHRGVKIDEVSHIGSLISPINLI